MTAKRPQQQILFINRSHWRSQAANAVQQINTAHALARCGARVEYAVLATEPVTPEMVLAQYGLEATPNLTVAPVLVPQRALGRAQLFLAKAAARLLSRQLWQPATVLLTRESRLLLLARGLRRPAVLEAHDLADLDFRFDISERTRQRHLRAIRAALGVVTVTQACAREMQRVCAIPAERIMVAPDAARPRTIAPPRASLADGAPLQVTYVGSMWPDRGVETLLLMLPHLALSARLVMVGGNAEQLAWLRERAAQLGVAERVDFPGHVPHHEAPGWLERSDVLVLPMRPGRWADTYASPMKLFEYMAAGRPMVAADVSTIREIVGERETAFYQPDDPSSLARALEQIAAGWEQALACAANARALLEQHYTYEHRARRILAWLDALTARTSNEHVYDA